MKDDATLSGIGFCNRGRFRKTHKSHRQDGEKEGRQKTKFCSQVGPLNTVYGSAMNESYAKPEQM